MAPAIVEASAAAPEERPGPYRVMIVDDSVVVRGLITRALEADPEIEVVASVGNGLQALNAAQRNKIEVVVLDIEMPVMDGMTALGKLLELDPTIKVIMASTLTKRNAEISIKALAAGAADYLAKPTATRELVGAADFQRELLGKVKGLGAVRRGGAGRVSARALRPGEATAPGPAQAPTRRPMPLRRPGAARPELLAIASSTGGPQALMTVLGGLDPRMTLPIVVTQHMPPTFTTILAEHLARQSKRPCREAADGEPILPGHIYIAPGDFHLLGENKGGRLIAKLDKGPPENFCRPAADPMLRSLAEACGGKVLVLVLTGMGQDGLSGARTLADSGGTVVAQDEATSVVWGMPGAAAQAGICAAILPVGEIPAFVQKFVLEGRI
ncbi:MAG TPA: chemotaxis response regulator protein-glutamate methylesterase [Alphaproteobacteria bacterium]|nr:chemotaxis response regulator protein-glutamate methylesterase [Alphaproteobacteria bacterium]